MTAAVVSTGFTSSFIDRLGASTRQLESFVSKTKTTADETFANLKATREEEQHSIDKLLRQLKTLEHERGVAADCARGGSSSGGVAKQRKELDEKQAALKDEVSRLQARNQLDQSQLQDVLLREAELRRKADAQRKRKEDAEMEKGLTIQDLTKGLLNYKFTGLSFSKGCEDGSMNFKFTRIDPEKEAREFTFTIHNDDEGNLVLTKCNVSLDERKTTPLIEQLNSDRASGFNTFMIGIRKLFKETLQS